MSYTFSDLQEDLRNEVSSFSEHDKLIAINNMEKTGMDYYTEEIINDKYLTYIKDKIEDGNLFTDPQNHFMCMQIGNAIYLDGDWYFPSTVSETEYHDLSLELANEYSKRWITELNDDEIHFTFVPEAYPKTKESTHTFAKGGFHVLIFTKRDVTKDSRVAIYNKIKQSFESVLYDKFASKICVKTNTGIIPLSSLVEKDATDKLVAYQKLFDESPTFNRITLLPFAQKSATSRRYMLDLKSSSPCLTTGEGYPETIMNAIYYPSKSTLTAFNSSSDTSDLVIDFDFEPSREALRMFSGKKEELTEASALKTPDSELNIKDGIVTLDLSSGSSTMSDAAVSISKRTTKSKATQKTKRVKPVLSIPSIPTKSKEPEPLDIDFSNIDLGEPEPSNDTTSQAVQQAVHEEEEQLLDFGSETNTIVADELLSLNEEQSVKIVSSELGQDTVDMTDDDLELDKKLREIYIKGIEKRKYKKEYTIFGNENGEYYMLLIKSLLFLSDRHRFWEILDNEPNRLKLIFTPFIQIVVINYLEENEYVMPDYEMLIQTCAVLFLPLLKKTANAENQKRTSLSYVMKQFEIVYTNPKYANIEGRFTPEMLNAMRAASNKSKGKDKKAKIIIPEPDQNEIDDAFDAAANGDELDLDGYVERHQKAAEEASQKALDAYIKELNQQTILRARYTKYVRFCFANWNKFIRGILMHYFSDELHPFEPYNSANPFELAPKPYSNRRELTFDDIRRERYERLHTTFYDRAVRIWFLHFFAASLYENSGSVNDAIKEVLVSFTKYDIFVNYNGGNKELYVYNYRQTDTLSHYPYNQWSLDDPESEKSSKVTGVRTKEWLKKLYNDIIKSELETSNKARGIGHLISIPDKYGLIIPAPGKNATLNSIKPLKDYDKDIDKMFANIISAIPSELISKPPIEESTNNSNVTFGRNGCVKFDERTGEIIYSLQNNHDIYSRSVTNIIFDEHYYEKLARDPALQSAYKLISDTFKYTFPIPDLRVYIERIIASMFVKGMHDTFLIMFGSGGEGKSIFCNMISAALGSDSIGRSDLKDATDFSYFNPSGMATTIKSATLLTTSREGHDEGGIIHTKDKRFVSMQEPSKTNGKCILNTSVIKDLTSGGATNARGIFGRNQAFVVNCIPVLQTNVPPQFDEDTDAVRRRVSIIPMMAKFYTDINKSRAKLQYSHKADDTLNIRIQSDILLPQALFYYLLEENVERNKENRIAEIIRHRWTPTTQIPRPKIVTDLTTKSFTESGGISGWLSQHIYECKNDCVSMHDIIVKILEEQKKAESNGRMRMSEGPLAGIPISRRISEIVEQVCTRYSAKVYRLHDRFYLMSELTHRKMMVKNVNIPLYKEEEHKGEDEQKEEAPKKEKPKHDASRKKTTNEELSELENLDFTEADPNAVTDITKESFESEPVLSVTTEKETEQLPITEAIRKVSKFETAEKAIQEFFCEHPISDKNASYYGSTFADLYVAGYRYLNEDHDNESE